MQATALAQNAFPFVPAISDCFQSFHQDNPTVYRDLVAICRSLKAQGFTHYSADAVYHVLRYQRDINLPVGDDGFKLNNNYTSRYARMIMANEPDLAGFFHLRNLKAA
jgi:hypothetical protein